MRPPCQLDRVIRAPADALTSGRLGLLRRNGHIGRCEPDGRLPGLCGPCVHRA